MNIVVKAQNLHPQKHNIDVEISIPTTCPRCGVAYREYPKDTYIFQCDSIVNYIGTRVYSFYFCPHCGKGFLVEYSVLDDFHHFITDQFEDTMVRFLKEMAQELEYQIKVAPEPMKGEDND